MLVVWVCTGLYLLREHDTVLNVVGLTFVGGRWLSDTKSKRVLLLFQVHELLQPRFALSMVTSRFEAEVITFEIEMILWIKLTILC